MSSVFAGFRFPPEVISLAVRRWCLRYGLSYRDVEELLAERGITGVARVPGGAPGTFGVHGGELRRLFG